jgi:hypothetical protein
MPRTHLQEQKQRTCCKLAALRVHIG